MSTLISGSRGGLLYNDVAPLLSSKNETQSLFIARVYLKYDIVDAVCICEMLSLHSFRHLSCEVIGQHCQKNIVTGC